MSVHQVCRGSYREVVGAPASCHCAVCGHDVRTECQTGSPLTRLKIIVRAHFIDGREVPA